jgi:type III restriction enzyme
MGFDDEEARQAVEPAHGTFELFAPRDKPPSSFRHRVRATPEGVAALEAIPGVAVREIGGGAVEVQIIGPIDTVLENQIASALPTEERGGFGTAVQKFRADSGTRLSPAETGASLTVPRLMAWVQEQFEFADTDVLMEFSDWSITNHPALLSESEFNVQESSHSFQIDLDGHRITAQFLSEEEQLVLDIAIEG